MTGQADSLRRNHVRWSATQIPADVTTLGGRSAENVLPERSRR
jgi:hypothetical protein